MTEGAQSPVDAITDFALQQRLISDGLQSKLDWVFFTIASAASIWLGWLVINLGMRSGWWQILFWIAFWLFLAYLVLPRIHRILTTLYVPNYFIGRTRTADGLLGDPVNLALRGEEAQIHAAMTKAGWIRADDISWGSSIKIVTSTILRKSYAEAPVSSLFLFGQKQDFAYQQEVDGSPGKRHHVRFWRSPEGWLLPGGTAVDWLAAGTYDRKVGFSAFTLQITHKIAPDTDVERDHIIKTIREAEPGVQVEVLRDFSTGYHARNGGGDSIQTDGNLPIVEMKSVSGAGYEQAVEVTKANFRPMSIIFGAVMIWIGAAVEIVAATATLLGDYQLADALGGKGAAADTVLIVVMVLLVAALFKAVLGWFVFIGSGGARVLVLLISVFTLVSSLGLMQLVPDKLFQLSTIYPTAVDILVLLAMSSESAATYVRRAREKTIERRAKRSASASSAAAAS